MKSSIGMTTEHQRRRPPRFELSAGHLCLDFVNTLDDRPSGKPKELLERYTDLARFAEDTGILSELEVDELAKRSLMDPEGAAHSLRYAIELREAIYGIVSAVMKKQPVPAKELAQLNGQVQHAAEHSYLVRRNGKFEWQFDRLGGFDAIAWRIARSAAELLSSDELGFVRACSSKSCQWLFLDTSKNHRRRWCSMKLCGNRSKAQRFYARRKSAS